MDHLLRAELTHSAGIFRIKITKVASGQARSHPRCSRGTRASPLPLKLGLFSFFFVLLSPRGLFYVTQTDQDGERLRGVCEQRRSSSARRVRGVHTSQALCNTQGHVAILLCALREEEKKPASVIGLIKMIQQSWEITSNVFLKICKKVLGLLKREEMPNDLNYQTKYPANIQLTLQHTEAVAFLVPQCRRAGGKIEKSQRKVWLLSKRSII